MSLKYAHERIAECIDFKKGKGDYDGLLSVMLHHQYSEEILEVHPTQGQIDGFFSQPPPEPGGICGRLT